MRIAWYASAEMLGTVAPEVFVPRPRVTSALVGMVRRDPPRSGLEPAEVFPFIETAYRQRRKMLRSTLSASVPAEAFEAAGIASSARPEELDIGQWADLAASVRAGRPVPTERTDGQD